MKIFDTHAHYDDDAFDEDRDSLLESMQAQGIERIMNVGASMQTSKTTIALTEKFPFIYGAIGVHPEETKNLSEADMDWLEKQSHLEKICAIGEIGLDYYWDSVPREIQKKWFERQLTLAQKVDLPVIIHSREAARDTIEILKASVKRKPLDGIIHCYSYTKESVKDYLNLGFYFGIGGVLTFKNAKKLVEAIYDIPLDRIVLETDCPYLAPEPNRGKRNSSLNLPYVISKIAEIKGVSEQEVAERTYQNGNHVYRLSE